MVPRGVDRTAQRESEWGGFMGLRRRRRHLQRYQEVVQTLVSHGFLYVVDLLGLGPLVGAAKRLGRGGARPVDVDWPERLSLVLTGLGPTFVKLGQVASTRSDVLPARVVKSLEGLQDAVPPFPFSQVENTLRRVWQREIKEVLASLDPEPLAAASIGQVHRGVLPDGTRVVVKVRRPGIVEQSRTDFEILKSLATLTERKTDWGKSYGVGRIVDELILTMEDEMDFTIEGRNTDTARRQLMTDGRVRVPQVFWEITAPEVLVMSELAGTKIADSQQIRQQGLDPKSIAQHLVQVMYQQIFLDGFFHADPHPGNVHVGRDGELLFLDWGMVGRLSSAMRERSVDLLLGMMQRRSYTVVHALLRLGVVDGDVDRQELERDVERLRRRYYEAQLSDFQLGNALTDLFSMANRHHIRIPGEYALLAKTAVTLDGLVRRLDPDASLIELGQSFAGRLVWSRWGPSAWAEGAVESAMQLSRLAERIPSALDRVLDHVERGEIHIVMEHKNLDGILEHWERLANRIGFSFLLGALIVGSALVVHRDNLDQLAALPLGEYVFLAAAVMALWVIIGAVRRGRL